MSNKSKNHGKKWLISRLKTSGSKKRYVVSGDYADERNTKARKDWDNLPQKEAMGKSFKFFNSKVNYGLLIRFLKGNVGGHWPDIYDEIMERIPTNLSEYKDCVNWFVAHQVERKEEGLWDKMDQKWIMLTKVEEKFPFDYYNYKEFYVDPDTQTLCHVNISYNQHQTKGLDRDELRQYRENEKKEKRTLKSEKKDSQMSEETFREVIRKSNLKKK